MAEYATRGPVPKRTELRRRANAPDEGAEIKTAPRGSEPTWMDPPDPDDPIHAWHPIAFNWYIGAQESGQVFFYEQTDADLAYLLGEEISRLLKPQFVGMARREEIEYDKGKMVTKTIDDRPVYAYRHIGGANLAAILKGMTNLLMTEADRRRARVELGNLTEQTSTAETEADKAAALLTIIQGGLA